MTLIADSAINATAILAAAWIVTRMLRRASADLRHRIWLAAIFTTAVLPFAMRIAATALPVSARIIVSASPAVAAAARVSNFSWVAAIWIAGMAAVLGRLALGCFAVARLGRGEVVFSDRVQTPMMWGAIRPSIILPSYMRDGSGEQLEIVMRHERAHIERRDWLWQTMARMVTAVFWFHPLAWLADAELRREAERAADDRVLSEGTSAPDYAEQLLIVARRLNAGAPAYAVAMARHPNLQTRVREILDANRDRSRTGIISHVAIVTIAAALLAPLAVMGQDNRVYHIGGDVKPPTVLVKVEPVYTQAARDAKIQGTTVLRLVINPDGTASDFEVVRSLDPGLDQNAIDAVRQWTFAPGTKNGKPVRVLATIEINFRLN